MGKWGWFAVTFATLVALMSGFVGGLCLIMRIGPVE